MTWTTIPDKSVGDLMDEIWYDDHFKGNMEDLDARVDAIVQAPDYILIVDEKTSGTSGGTFTSGAWQVRNLTVEKADAGGHASLAANQITLEAGTYRCKISCPALKVDAHMARLYDTTGTAVLLTGTSEYSDATAFYSQSRSYIIGRFTLAVQSVLEVQHRCATTQATNGFGNATSLAAETYTVVELWRDA